MRTVISTFDVEVRGHLYHAEIIDQRAYRKWQKNSGRSYSLVEPYEYKAVCDDADLPRELCIIEQESYTKPAKKCIKAEIEYKHQRYEDACKQAAFKKNNARKLNVSRKNSDLHMRNGWMNKHQ